MKNYILYGAGKYVPCFLQLIQYLGDSVQGIIDGDINKQGMHVCGVRIFPPEYLYETDSKIIISCLAVDEIKAILKQMDVLNREVSIEEYLSKVSRTKTNTHDSTYACKEYIFDLYSSAKWGGAENWNYYVASYFQKLYRDFKISLVADDSKELYLRDNISITRFKRSDDIERIIKRVSGENRICFVNSFFELVFFALLADKIKNPKKIILITIVHNDYKDLYKICKMFETYISMFICVSSKIQRVMIEQYGIPDNKAVFLPQPIEYKDFAEKNEPNGRIRIGIATRLTKRQKRADLIPEIIKNLERKRIDYVLNIAGEGECYSQLEEYIINKKLSKRVILHGRIEHDKIWDFWLNEDVYLSISDFEGASLSMLEAMSCSCVPIVTDVSGTRDYIIDGENGFIHDIEDIDGICNSIEFLANNMHLISEMGHKSRNSIVEKCNIDAFAKSFGERVSEVTI